jgi:hypothetical protein
MEEGRSAFKILRGTSVGKIPLARPRRRWEIRRCDAIHIYDSKYFQSVNYIYSEKKKIEYFKYLHYDTYCLS